MRDSGRPSERAVHRSNASASSCGHRCPECELVHRLSTAAEFEGRSYHHTKTIVKHANLKVPSTVYCFECDTQVIPEK